MFSYVLFDRVIRLELSRNRLLW